MRKLIIIFCVVFAVSSSAFAAKKSATKRDANEQSAADPVVTIEPPKSNRYKKIALFPLELPEYAFRAATFPIGIASRYMERHKVIERAADFLSNDDNTLFVYPIIEGGAGSSFGGGPALKAIDLFHKGYELSAYYKVHINLDQMAGATIGKKDQFRIGGTPVSWSFTPQWQRLPNQYFYGIGNDTNRNNRAEYLINQSEFIGQIAAHPFKHFSAGFIFSNAIETTGNDGTPYIDTLFPPSTLTNFGRWTSYGMAGLRIAHDTRDNTSLPESGGVQSAAVKRYQHFGEGDFSYNQYELDIKHFFRLGRPRHVLALHNGWVFKQVTGNNQIPFYRLATLDVYTPLRGFKRQRFTDRNSCIFNAEYRFPLWSSIDGVIFGDTGRVFHTTTDFSFKKFKYSAGGGLRMSGLGMMLFRLDIAYGGEGVNFVFGMSRSL